MKLKRQIKQRSIATQGVWGALIMMLGISVERLLWDWVGSHHLIMLIPWVILAAWFVGGRVAGVSATLIGLLAWLVYFRPLTADESPASCPSPKVAKVAPTNWFRSASKLAGIILSRPPAHAIPKLYPRVRRGG